MGNKKNKAKVRVKKLTRKKQRNTSHRYSGDRSCNNFKILNQMKNNFLNGILERFGILSSSESININKTSMSTIIMRKIVSSIKNIFRLGNFFFELLGILPFFQKIGRCFRCLNGFYLFLFDLDSNFLQPCFLDRQSKSKSLRFSQHCNTHNHQKIQGRFSARIVKDNL